MDTQALNRVIKDLEIIQIKLMQQRRDHNGQVLQHDDIDVINTTIEIINNLIIEPNFTWKITKRQGSI